MTSIPELGASLNIPIQDVIRMGEDQIRNPESAIYKSVESKVMQKLAAMRSVSATETKKKGGKTRVYIQHHVEAEYRFSLTSAFPQFEIRFSSVDKRSGATAMAVNVLVAEYMLSKYSVKQGRVFAYGVSLKQIVLRNRDWIHLCIPGHTVRAQSEFKHDDKSIGAITHSLAASGRPTALAGKYMDGKVRVHCASSTECTEKAVVGVMLLDKTDTNFRQVALTMRQHGTRLLYFAIPASKEMELGLEGKVHSLDAHVFPSHGGERINIMYKNAPSLDMSYLYSNYLELVARTSVVIDGQTYHKEFDGHLHGYNVYKVTRLDAVFDEEPPPYKSWCEPKYENKYLAYLPILAEGGRVSRAQDWSLVGHPIDRDIVDDVADFAMRAQGTDKVSQRIEQRLFSRTSNYTLVNQVVHDTASVPIHLFDPLCLALYCGVFMRKFEDGKAVSTLAPHARQIARLAQSSTMGVTQAYVGMILGNAIRAGSVVTDAVRAAYYSTITEADLPTPSFAVCPGYIEYSDRGSSNPRFRGWQVPEYHMNYGFSTSLPGVSRSEVIDGLTPVSDVATTVSADVSTVEQLVASGEAFINIDGSLNMSSDRSVVELAMGIFSSVRAVFDVPFDIEEVVESNAYKGTPMQVDAKSMSVAKPAGMLYSQVPQKKQQRTDAPGVVALKNKIADQSGGFVSVRKEGYTENKLAFTPGLPEHIPGHYADDAKEYLRDAILRIFPNSLTMNTSQFETDRTYSGWELLTKVIKAKLDVSKISGVRPESYYKPLLRGHVHPNVKNNFSLVTHATAKRNFNTPVLEDAMDTEFLWNRAWIASLKVYYVEGAEEQLAAMPYIGPDERSVHEWASKLDDAKRERLLNTETGFFLPDLVAGASATHLMAKGKLKPTLDASYASAVKYPQTIQYDPTGKSVAVFSPMIAQKVAREQQILKPNVLVLQGKSIDDVNAFLNGFDWRENEKGVRHYIEIDYSQYDKSQGGRLADMYLKRLSKFGLLPQFIQFIKDNQHVRTIAAMKAGLKAWLRDQNMSGAAFTLDRNNDINELVIADLLVKILDKIEFIILMGDDILIAVRGDVDVSEWEVDLSRKFNLTLKAAINDHGYICSMDVCHLPGGHSRVVADVVKRALSFMDQSIVDEEKFKERFISYVDGMKGVDDLNVQVYLAAALPPRMQRYLPGTTSDCIMALCKAHSRLRKDYGQYRAMFAQESTLRTY
jgi:hypothetical protein